MRIGSGKPPKVSKEWKYEGGGLTGVLIRDKCEGVWCKSSANENGKM
ncbi:hypothetical protein [Rickettsiales endosymbiont of Peranema trichophorum]|nr:hypothetical protein [Rickettsiales endosymbiont of Peranema trichophorum]